MITVAQLIDLLMMADKDDVVIMSKDEEGNDFSPLCEVAEASYKPDSSWSGEVYIRELTEEDKSAGYTESDLCKECINCVVLWPTN